MSNRARMSGRSRGGRSSSFSHVACSSASRRSPARLVRASSRSGLSAGAAAEATAGGGSSWMLLLSIKPSSPSGLLGLESPPVPSGCPLAGVSPPGRQPGLRAFSTVASASWHASRAVLLRRRSSPRRLWAACHRGWPAPRATSPWLAGTGTWPGPRRYPPPALPRCRRLDRPVVQPPLPPLQRQDAVHLLAP